MAHCPPMTRSKSARARRSAGRDFLHLLWQAPAYAIPFALFFQITSGQPFAALPQFYVVSLVFAGFSLLGVWVAQHWLAPPIIARSPNTPGLTWKLSLLHGGVALLFAAAGAILLHLTILPGFLGSGRAVLTLVAYFVLFGLLFVGLA